jgi:AraC-like DNA-binding protein
VTQIVDSGQTAAPDRIEAAHEVACNCVPVELHFPVVSGPVVRGVIADLGPLRVSSIRSNATKVERTPRQARDQLMPSVLLGLQQTGSGLVVQHGREAEVRPGDLVLYESTAPYTLLDPDGYRQCQIRVPIEKLALPHDMLRQVSAVRLAPGHPVADLAAIYFRRIASRPDSFAHAGSDAVSQPSIEMLRAVIATHLDAAGIAADSRRATLQLRILEYVRAHLHEPTLSAAQIAAEHHISVRHLYNVLADGGISLGDWIRTHRLEGCRKELGRPAARRMTIASVAQRWGFTNASSFGRIFRAAYGLSPREWRDSADHDLT